MDDNYTLVSLLQEKFNSLKDENKKLQSKIEETQYFFERKIEIENENETLKERINFLIFENSEKTKEIESCKTAINLFKKLLKYI